MEKAKDGEMKLPTDKSTLQRYLVEYPRAIKLRLVTQGRFTFFKKNKRKLLGLTTFMNRDIYPNVTFRKRLTTKGNSSKAKGSRTHKIINELLSKHLRGQASASISVTLHEKQIFESLMNDLDKLQLVPVGTEVLIYSGKCGTAIDLLCCRKKKWNDLVVVEMKTGYTEGVDNEYKADGEMVLPEGMELKNTSKNRHLLQALYSSLIFNDMYSSNLFKVKKSCVVYLDGIEREGQMEDKKLNFSWFKNVLDSINKKTAEELLQKLK